MTEEPRLSAREMIERLEPALSRARRVRAVVSLLSGLSGTAFMIALWTGEPGPLPSRTQVVFALLIVACLAWAGYGGWLLMRRVPLFATDRVIAAWIALAASLATTAALATMAVRRGTGLAPVLGVGGLFVAAALVLTVLTHTRRAALLRRARELRRTHPASRTHTSGN
ncbi:hypothetical protein [Microbispora bryophytorum]|uniref:Transmembrane transport protein n=1 Tax=Microbispora bryophytorum TaxID=1460882 RepID=A0A8H9H238_9ACTN|nr:hypothetical protein [Microbispora bryophytorum]MBD3137662.1 hypothetical protein [Microbispora bryophytorum]TQS05946.1 hypothetical protein FLX07_16410 [Microbispora bryophytorum]GGO20260.1 hypothetical protein GCM10011574_46560 [Microbispora bryophytorum]